MRGMPTKEQNRIAFLYEVTAILCNCEVKKINKEENFLNDGYVLYDQLDRLKCWKEGFFVKRKVKNSLPSFTYNCLDLA